MTKRFYKITSIALAGLLAGSTIALAVSLFSTRGGVREEILGGETMISEGIGNGMRLSASAAERSSVGQESFTATATVAPNNEATNSGVQWSVAWKNPSSAFATGKTVTNYVTVTPSGSGYDKSKTATVTAVREFGEPVILTAASEADPEIKATCQLDYLQTATDFSLSFGDVACNFGGETNVSVNLLPSGGITSGGTATPNLQKATVYTVPVTYSMSYALSPTDLNVYLYDRIPNSSSGGNLSFDESRLAAYSVASKGLYFGFEQFVSNFGLKYYFNGMGQITEKAVFDEYTTQELIALYNTVKASETDRSSLEMFSLTATVSRSYTLDGKQQTTSKDYKTTFIMGGYTTDSQVKTVTLNETAHLFGK